MRKGRSLLTAERVHVHPLQPFPVYLPAYVVEYSYLGYNFRALVNGMTGHVGGERHYSSFKIGGLAGLATAFALASAEINVAATPSLVSIGLVSLVAGALSSPPTPAHS